MSQHSAGTAKANEINQAAQAAFPCRTRTIVQAVAFALFAGSTFSALAMPTGGEVAAGSATISAVTNNRMQIDQSSQNAVLNWQGFSIAGNESVHFQQPNGGIALNRVLGTNPSEIFGQLSATGKLFLVNPNGVFFAPGSSVDVGGLVASTLNMSDSDFMAGNFRFINGGAAKNILNQGTLHAADGGYIALLAPEVVNEGVVSARLGTVAFGSGDKVRLDMNGDDLLGMVVEKSAVQGLIDNKQMAQVSGGQVIMSARAAGEVANSVINNAGVIKATGLVERDGVIRLEASLVTQHGVADAGSKGSVDIAADSIMSSGTTKAAGGDIAMQADSIYLDGSIDASNAGGTGGSVSLSGHTVDIASSGTISVDGATGGSLSLASDAGGRVLVSGALSAQGSAGEGGHIQATAWNLSLLGGSADADGQTQGGSIWWGSAGADQRGAMTQAENTLVSTGATLSAKGATGKGGEIINYGTSSLDFLGSAQAQGVNGNGGFIEVSSQGDWSLAQQAQLDAGVGGTLLIDPKNIIIDAATSDPQHYARQALTVESGTGPAADGSVFGVSVSLDNDRMAVGSLMDKTGGTEYGAVYLFDGMGTGSTFSTPHLALKLTNGSSLAGGATLTLHSGDRFGSAVALQGERLAVGAQYTDYNFVDTNGTPQTTADVGAVYLFDGLNASGAITNTPHLATEITLGSAISFGGAPTTLELHSGDSFGEALSLDGNRLAVGSYTGDSDPRGPVDTDRGSIYLFDGFGASGAFDTSNVRLANQIADGSGVGNGQHLSLQNGDNFGSAIALKGDVMAVGAWGTGGNHTGAIYLFTGMGASNGVIDTPLLVNKLGDGSALAAGSTASILNLNSGNNFGSGLSIDGDHLAVGAYGTYGGGANGLQGAVYLFDGMASLSSASPTLRLAGTLANNTPILAADGTTMTTLHLNEFDDFGASVALQGGRLAVGADHEVSSNDGHAVVYLFDVSDIWNNGWTHTYSSNAAATQHIAPNLISGLLATGQNLVLQANNDITLAAASDINVAGTTGGALTMQAGRSIILNSSITTANGNLSILANQPASTGVVDADRDAGNAVITLADGASIDAGTGSVSMRLGNGAGNTNRGSGAITLGGATTASHITAGSIEVVNQGSSAGSDVVLTNRMTLNASSGGTNITLAAAGTGGGTVTNQGSDNLVTGAGRFLVYSDAPGTTTEGISSYNKRYNTAYGSTTGVAATGNYFLYSVAPTLNVAANAGTSIYGDADSALTYGVTGFIDGDTAGTALGGALARTAGSNAGTYAINQGSLADLLGYTISYTGANYVITPKALTLSAATAANKVYDGNTSATVTGFTLTGFVGSETVDASSGSANFSDKNVATGKTVTINGITLANGTNGGLASNYTVAGSTTTTADITARTITTASVTADNKVYDGTTAATVHGLLGSDVISGDTVSLGGGSGSFSDKNAGTGKTVATSGMTLGGADAGNYVLAPFSTTATADITARGLTIASFTADNKVYDGTVAATVHGTLDNSNIVSGDSVGLGTTGSFSDKNAGNGKTVTASAISLTGADAGNYTIAPGAMTATADISARNITASVTGTNKVYDGNTTATVAGQLDQAVLVTGDIVAVTAASASFADKNVGNGKTVTATGLQLSGADAGNYVLANAGASATVNADITPRSVTVSIGADGKVYDATTAATLNSQSLANGVSGDDLSFGIAAANFSDKNVGNGKTVTASGLSLGGADAGNYVLSSATATTTANITPLTISATSVTAANKVYDGSTAATVGGSLSGVIGGDNVALGGNASFSDRNVGTAKAVTGTLALNGADAGNYVLASNTANTSADITLRSLTVRADDKTRFEGQANPAFTASYDGLAAGDTSSVVTGLVLMSPAITSSPLGSYAITASGASAQNYQVSMVDGVLSIVPVPPLPVFNTQVDAAVVSAQQLLTVNSAVDSAIQVAQASDEDNQTTGARSGDGSSNSRRSMLEIRGTGIRLPEGVNAQ